MNTRSAVISAFALVAGLVSLPALACKELVRFPEHLTVSTEAERSSYFVVVVQRAASDGFAVLVKQSFGGPLAPGTAATIQFTQAEEPHAVCPIDVRPGETYLFRGAVHGASIEVSRYNWLNVPATHERFATYVRDLQPSK